MGTPQNDTSWAGWAISSFTNKLTTASGQMQAASNGDSKSTSPEPRPNSVPPSKEITRSVPTATTPSGLNPQVSSLKPSSVNPFASSNASQADEDDLDTGWGDNIGWGEEEKHTDPFASDPPQTIAGSTAPFEDKGEPDFAGWLNAQAQAKQKVKNALPKGLSKTSAAASRPGLGAKASSTGNVPVRKVAATASKAKVAPVKKTEPKAEPQKEDDNDDAWADAW
jgi:SCY1-like protein 1